MPTGGDDDGSGVRDLSAETGKLGPTGGEVAGDVAQGAGDQRADVDLGGAGEGDALRVDEDNASVGIDRTGDHGGVTTAHQVDRQG